MSLAKQIGYAILATITIVIFGFGSYYASNKIFPNPKPATSTTTNNTNSGAKKYPTVEDQKRLTPQNINVVLQGDVVVLSFETPEDLVANIYVTQNKTEKIVQSMKDYNNGVMLAGRFFVVDEENKPSKTHSVKIPKTVLSTNSDAYYFILLKYKTSWLPYGKTMDYPTGPSEAYYMKL